MQQLAAQIRSEFSKVLPFLRKPAAHCLYSERSHGSLACWSLLRGLGLQMAVTDSEQIVMLTVLGLIDVVMIANLLIMVIVGGYETFVSRLNLQGHPDQPEWLSFEHGLHRVWASVVAFVSKRLSVSVLRKSTSALCRPRSTASRGRDV